MQGQSSPTVLNNDIGSPEILANSGTKKFHNLKTHDSSSLHGLPLITAAIDNSELAFKDNAYSVYSRETGSVMLNSEPQRVVSSREISTNNQSNRLPKKDSI